MIPRIKKGKYQYLFWKCKILVTLFISHLMAQATLYLMAQDKKR